MIKTEEINKHKSEALTEVSREEEEKTLHDVKVKYLGKKDDGSGLMKKRKNFKKKKKEKLI
ncbi:hypothetical protein [Staphylococcus simulans]